MKALTLSQPNASLVADGEKFVENRSWETKYCGLLAIHAGKGTQYMKKREILEADLPFGQVVAIAELQGCVDLAKVRTWQRRDWGRSELGLPAWLSVNKFLAHEHTEGPWCWIFGNVRKLAQPIDAIGAQGIWNWKLNGSACQTD